MSILLTSGITSAESDARATGRLGSWSEEKLVAASKGGQTTAFVELCERHAKKMFGVIHRITRNREDAEDALQDSFLRAFVHIREFDGRSSFSTWVTRIAINSALMILRKKRTYSELPLDGPDDSGANRRHWEVADWAPNPEKRYAQRERNKILWGAIRNLRPALRRVVEIQLLQERSMKETAELMGISIAAAKGRLFHAKHALRKSGRLKSYRLIGLPAETELCKKLIRETYPCSTGSGV